MKKHGITDEEAAALLRGENGARADLAELADSIAQFRAASFETAPRPSAELMARLDASGASSATAATVSHAVGEAAATPVAAISQRRRIRRMIAWFAGLGVLAKIAFGSTVALAAFTGVGAAGALPGGAQEAFDNVVTAVVPDSSVVTPTESPSPEPSETHDVGDDDSDDGVEDESDESDDDGVEDESDESDDDGVENESDESDDNGSDDVNDDHGSDDDGEDHTSGSDESDSDDD